MTKRQSESRTASAERAPAGSGSILIKEQVDRLGIVLEQIEGCAELLMNYLKVDFDVENDNGAMTALNVITEKAQEAAKIIECTYGKLPPSVLTLRENNIKRHEAAVREIDERAAKAKSAGLL